MKTQIRNQKTSVTLDASAEGELMILEYSIRKTIREINEFNKTIERRLSSCSNSLRDLQLAMRERK